MSPSPVSTLLSSFSRIARRLWPGLLALACACSDKGDVQKATPPAPARHGLTEEQAKEPLVLIGDAAVTVGDFADQLADKSPYLRARYASPERRRELLDELVKFELLAKEAEARGLDQSEEVQRTKRQLMVQQMLKAEFDDKVKLSDISEDEISRYYDAHPDEFHKPEQVRASVVVVKDEARAKKLWKQVVDAQGTPDEDAEFRALATSTNEDASLKARAGDLQFFSRPKDRKPGDAPVPDAVAEAAFALDKIGDVAREPVKTPDGYAIVKLTGKRKELARTLEQTRRTIQHKLWREKREAAIATFVEGLRTQAHVEANWALLDQVQGLDQDAGAVLSRPDAGARSADPTRKTAP